MKRIAAIVLLITYLFNLGGYRVLFHYVIQESDKILNEQILDNSTKSSNLVEIKLPVKLPDIYNWDSFHQVTGQVQLKHHCYNYVELKITKDTLYLMCQPKYTQNISMPENVICAKEINDLPDGKKLPDSAVKKFDSDSKHAIPFARYQFEPAFKLVSTMQWEPLFSDQPLIAVHGHPPETIC